MPSFQCSRTLPYAACDLFEIAAHVEKYPEFVPFCSAAHLSKERVLSPHVHAFEATLTVVYPKFGLSQDFLSHVVCDRERLEVISQGSQGVLKNLSNHWHFYPLSPESTRVEVATSYDLGPFALRFLMSLSADYMTTKMVHAFESRAHALLGGSKNVDNR